MSDLILSEAGASASIYAHHVLESKKKHSEAAWSDGKGYLVRVLDSKEGKKDIH